MSFVWVIIAAAVILALLSGGNKSDKSSKSPGGTVRIDRPHVIDDDDYECSACHRRFRKDVMACPYCGARFTSRVKDEDEFIFEEDELEAWDEEEGR